MEAVDPPATVSSKRSSAISPSDIHHILAQASSTVAQPSPVEHISTSRPTSSGVTAVSQHAGQPFPATSLSSSQPVVRPNRFSLTFPILPPSKEESPVRKSISPTRDIVQQATELASISADPHDGNFLTAIAAQERCVLEIKEELLKAEAELDRLKLLWATHEAQKKKSEARRVTKLRPVSMVLPVAGTDDVISPASQQQQELDRRRALLAGTRQSRGTVFSGSRHTRTLSLLTPAQKSVPASATSPNRPRRDTSPDKTVEASESAPKTGLARAATTPNLLDPKKNEIKLDLSELGIDGDAVLNTGKKVALGIKDGLWTFWEDLRQATVGEDVVQVIPPQHLRSQSSAQTIRSPRRGGSKSSLRGSSRGSTSSKISTDTKLAIPRSPNDKRTSPKRSEKASNLPPLLDLADPAIPPAEALASPRRTPTHSKRASKHIKSPSVAVSTASSDAWDGWDDSPGFSRSSSATSQSTSHLSPAQELQSTPSKVEKSTEPAAAQKDPLPWPALSKFPGATLRRTASHLMSEWDKLEPRKDKTDEVELKLELAKRD